MQSSSALTAMPSMTDEQFSRYALDVLQRELGAEGFVRFLRVYRAGTGDYTEERHKWLDEIPLDDVISELSPKQ